MGVPSIIRNDLTGFRKAFADNATTDSYPDIATVASIPTGDGSVNTELPYGAGYRCVPKSMLILPFGTDAEDEAFGLRLIGWKLMGVGEDQLWVPVNLGEFTCELGDIEADGLGDDSLLCDTIAAVGTIPHVSIYSPGDDTPAHVLLDLRGFARVEFQINVDTAASGNALYAFV